MAGDSGWKTIRPRGTDFEHCLAVHWSGTTRAQLVWQIQPFHSHLFQLPFYRWYDEDGKHNNKGKELLCNASQLLCPDLFVHCWRSARSSAYKSAWKHMRRPRKRTLRSDPPPLTDRGSVAQHPQEGPVTAEDLSTRPGDKASCCDLGGIFADAVTTPWLLVYLLRPATSKGRPRRDLAAKCYKLLDLFLA